MHELGIVFHTIRTIEDVAAEQGLTRVGSVTLELGGEPHRAAARRAAEDRDPARRDPL